MTHHMEPPEQQAKDITSHHSFVATEHTNSATEKRMGPGGFSLTPVFRCIRLLPKHIRM